MSCLSHLQTCLDNALSACAPVQPERLDLDKAQGAVLAEDICLLKDIPETAQAVRAGYAVAALDLVGACAALPIPLGQPQYVKPGDALPVGCDVVLPQSATEDIGAGPEAVQSPGPGEGVRRIGHDGRKGSVLLETGCIFGVRQAFAAAMAGLTSVLVRRPRFKLDLSDQYQERFAIEWAHSLGAQCGTQRPDLILRTADELSPRLAYAPADTAWLEHKDAGLVLHLPPRFDGFLAGILGLGIPALQHLSGATLCHQSRPVTRKITSSVGMAELVLLDKQAGGWAPFPSLSLSLREISKAACFAIIPPESEGLPAGAMLSAISLDRPFG
ncbi:MAG: hypothetical protein ACXIUW_03595 [Roseinatronobacter sp.]